MRQFNKLIFITAALVLLSGCVTKKKKDDVGPIGKAYQNMTARYNGYYNAGVLLQESMLNLEKQHQDNYNQILPIYKYTEADNPKAEAENLDKAIKKVSVVVNLHRVSHWTDDCYLLLGQAQFLKQDYEASQETFEFMAAEFDPVKVAEREAKLKAKKGRKKAVKRGKKPSSSGDDEKVELSKKEKEKLAKQKKKEREKERKQRNKEAKKRRNSKGKSSAKSKKPAKEEAAQQDKITENDTKKEDEKDEPEENGLPAPGSISIGDLQPQVSESNPESYFMKHRPAYQDGLLWLARAYTERENYTNAERLLTQLERSPSTFHDVRMDAAIAKADFYLQQKMYDKAVEPLGVAISLSNDRKMKARLSFILGQVHQKANRGAEAYAAFEQVLKYQPDFEMEFSAKVNLATAGVNSPDESVKQLERMLKEEKNKEYRDKIYFSLAQIALARGDKPEGIKNLELSLQNSSRNMSQKAESYLQLADLYFDDENFVKAKLYYDSTLMVLLPADERYGRVNRLAGNLDGIAQNIQIITLQDSLLRISRMTEEERKELAYEIKKKRDEEKLAALKAQASQQNAGGKAPVVPSGPQKGGIGNQSSFFAYNDKSVKDGQRDFQRKWGSRTLEDNWRRSNQQSFAPEGEAVAAKIKGSDRLTKEDIDEILKDVPDTPAEIATANREMEAAYFSLGALYRDKLQNYPKSIETLNELLNRYPETQYQLDALYYLYLSYKDMGDVANMNIYYDRIVNGYPNTTYAQILRDPNFLQSVAEKENKLTRYYNETYEAFVQRQFEAAYNRIAKVGELFGATNPLQPRFALLSAMCVGNIQGKENYVEALKEVIAKYPEAPEATRAKEILRLLGENVSSGPGQQRDLPSAAGQIGPYTPTDDQLHYVIVVFKKDISLNDAKISITDYNGKYHSLQKLRMNNIYLGDGDSKMPIIAIRRYTDRKDAMDYYNGVQKNKKDFLDEKKFEFEVFPVSQDNYRELLKSKDINVYRSFFESHYLK